MSTGPWVRQRMDSDLSALAILNLSIAARAHWTGLKALELGAAARGTPLSPMKVEALRKKMQSALAEIEDLVTDLELAWQVIPVDRQLRTQVERLQDSLYYASPDALGGFGDVEPATADSLSAWCGSAMEVTEILARMTERRAVQAEAAVPAVPAAGGYRPDALGQHQQPALNSFANAFAGHLVLAEAQALGALAPSHPTIESPYAESELVAMLAAASTLEGWLDALTMTFALRFSWGVTAAIVVQRSMHHALECLGLIADKASSFGDVRTPEFARLRVIAGRNQLSAHGLA